MRSATSQLGEVSCHSRSPTCCRSGKCKGVRVAGKVSVVPIALSNLPGTLARDVMVGVRQEWASTLFELDRRSRRTWWNGRHGGLKPRCG